MAAYALEKDIDMRVSWIVELPINSFTGKKIVKEVALVLAPVSEVVRLMQSQWVMKDFLFLTPKSAAAVVLVRKSVQKESLM